MRDKRFNENQLRAISGGEGPLLIAAGPGSGKTTVLTHRIKYIIEELGARPGSILVMTFSRAAAEEMKERFLGMKIRDADKVCFGTFHSVFFGILRTAYGSMAPGYIFGEDAEDQIRFDEMLKLAEELLKEREDICRSIRSRYRWILIDEFQDIDDLQYEIVRLIAPPDTHPNITVVGDDDQSIYAFRGANPRIMMNFENDYQGTEKVVLDVNYRSGREIVSAASKLIAHNNNRIRKTIVSARGNVSDVKILEFEDTRSEYEYLVRDIEQSVRSGSRENDIAVLHRNNMQPWQLTCLLKERKLENVHVMTFHKSKGLEFSEVWIIDACEGVTPDRKAVTAEDIEEERRLFYVAMTRARDRLRICRGRIHRSRTTKRSRFTEEVCG